MPARLPGIATAYLLAGLLIAAAQGEVPPSPDASPGEVQPAVDADPAKEIVQRLQGLDAATRAELVRYLQEDVPPPPAPLSQAEGSTARGLDPALVAQGQAAFQSYCIDCHDAERSLNKRKSFAGWLSTTKRMAAKTDANIPGSAVTPIATYLTSVASAGSGNGGLLDSARELMDGSSSFSPNATISTMWRGADQHDIMNPDFYADVWVGADWQPEGPLSATVMACTSCHSDFNFSKGYSVELVDGSATLDLLKLVDRDRESGRRGDGTTGDCGDCPAAEWTAKVKAGRFVVPFGAFQGMSHPGVYRTLDNPLIFDMGRRYSPGGIRYLPVFGAPYSDEGVNLDLGAPLPRDFSAGLSLYAVNGFQGDLSWSPGDGRSYSDNNRTPAGGARLTVGNSSLKFGASLMGGQMQDDGADDRLFYHCYGVDLVYRHEDLFRFYFEYAARQSDFKPVDDPEYFYGIVAEGELRIIKEPRIGFLVRYDTLEQHRYIVFPDSSIQRYTWGFTVALPGPTSLMLNHEIWTSSDFGEFHLLGARWVASF